VLAVLALGLVSCSTNLSDLVGDEGSRDENPLETPPGWSKVNPGSGQGSKSGTAGSKGGSDSASGGQVGRAGSGGPDLEGNGEKTHWCENALAEFCADFDTADSLGRFSAGAEGQVLPVVDPGFDVAGPYSLLIKVPATPNRTDAYSSKVTHHFNQRANGFLLDFQLASEQVSEERATVAAVEFLGNGAATYVLQLSYDAGALHFEEVRQGVVKRLGTTSLRTGENAWSHLVIDASFEAGQIAYFKIVNDDDPALDVTVSATKLSPTEGMSSIPSFVLGVVEGERPHGGWQFRYDNVSLDLYTTKN
jgi:hypothetical protein